MQRVTMFRGAAQFRGRQGRDSAASRLFFRAPRENRKLARRLLLLCVLVFASLAAAAEPLDFVVLLDISESMLPYFDDTVNYLIRDILKQHLAPADGFHLLTFANTPGIELTLDVEKDEDIDEGLERILLLQPLGQYTDLVSALKFVYSYTGSLRTASEKKILVLTDGIHDPPPGSPYPVSENTYLETATEVARDIRKQGWDIALIQFPTDSRAGAAAGGAGAGTGISERPEGSSAADTRGAVAKAAANGAPGIQPSRRGAKTPTVVAPATSGVVAPATPSAVAPTSEGPAVQSPDSGGDGRRTVVAEKEPSGTTAAESDAVAAKGGESPAYEAGTREDLYPVLAKDLDVEVLSYDEPSGDTTHRALGAPELVFPDNLGRVGYGFTLPFRVRNLSDERILVELIAIVWNATNILDSPVKITVPPEESRPLKARIELPKSIEPGALALELEAVFGDDLRIYPRKGTVSAILRGSGVKNAAWSAQFLPVLAYIGLGLLGALLLVLLVFGVRALVARIIATMGATAVQGVLRSAGDRAVEMHVEGQNPNIGTRNVNFIRDAGRASIGGGFSSYLIYLYRLPARIAMISRRGQTYTFTPVKPEFFEAGESIPDCLDRDITVLCAPGRRLTIRFRRYVSPLEKINAIMRLAQKPPVVEKEPE